MSDSAANAESPDGPSRSPVQYVVVARRYRPQTFDQLVGQDHIAQALSNAIATNRVGHAYLFAGARGVGKTSTARILAKALNCEAGPAPVPCNCCDICRSVGSGDDVDVLEIDGASNRGIDEIRQLRQNVNVRPSRARYKIYIIDEVHMLTREAFNALLKTLEEPPEHVKFIFCTTEPTKVPVTILSRCQRFDFAGILTGAIRERLRQIVEAEAVEVEPEALEVLARRAAGSMRDGESSLEQLLAFAPGRITLDAVHGMLGTAGEERLASMVRHLVAREAGAVLADLDAAIGEGVDVALLLEQLLGYLRDCMAALVGCPGEMFLYASPASRQEVLEAAQRYGLTTLLAAMQIVDHTLARLRFSTQGRILAELALVRICRLEDLDELSAVIAQLHSGTSASSPRGAPPRPAGSGGSTSSGETAAPEGAGSPAAETPQATRPEGGAPPLTAEAAAEVWNAALGKLSGLAVEQARQFERVTVAGPNHLVIGFKPGYAVAKSICEQPDQLSRFEKAMAEVAGRPVRVSFTVEEEPSTSRPAGQATRHDSPHQRLLEIVKHPMIRRAGELFGAQPVRVEEPPKEK